jgi:hypothetical protein
MRLFFLLPFLAAFATVVPSLSADAQPDRARAVPKAAVPLDTANPTRPGSGTPPAHRVELPRGVAVWVVVAIDGGLLLVTILIALQLFRTVGRLRDAMQKGGIAMESHWGGYGGGAGGWRISPAVGYLIAIVVLACLVALLAQVLQHRVGALTVRTQAPAVSTAGGR